MRDLARRIIRRVGVETGGSNIQFAINPQDGRIIVIEMNPRVSRSSALASKATGFPIAKIAAKLALGYHLDEIPNDITRETPASFEPTIDYVVVKVPRWAFEKFPAQTGRYDADEVRRRGDGDRPDVQGSVHEGLPFARARHQRAAVRADRAGGRSADGGGTGRRAAARTERAHRPPDVGGVPRARSRMDGRDLHDATKIDPWFLDQFSRSSSFALGRPRRACADVGRLAQDAQARRHQRPGDCRRARLE